jgi:hypothetical protein
MIFPTNPEAIILPTEILKKSQGAGWQPFRERERQFLDAKRFPEELALLETDWLRRDCPDDVFRCCSTAWSTCSSRWKSRFRSPSI